MEGPNQWESASLVPAPGVWAGTEELQVKFFGCRGCEAGKKFVQLSC